MTEAEPRTEDLVSAAQVALRFGVSQETLAHWEDTGAVTAIRLTNGHRRYLVNEVAQAVGAELLTIGPAAALLGVHPETLRRWEAAGRMTARRTPGGRRRYRRRDLEALRAQLHGEDQ
jgi:excisionase family DNA binding protein